MNVTQAFKVIDDFQETALGPAKSVAMYDVRAAEFRKAIETTGYKGPAKTAEIIASDFPRNRDKVKVLNVASGTGLTGVELNKFGFTQIDAVDPSQGMLALLKERNVYNRLICDYVDDKHQIDVPDNYYDAIGICGGMCNNHLQTGCFDEMIRLVKPGGIIVNVARAYMFTEMVDYSTTLKPYFRKLEASGKWREESNTTFKEYVGDIDGIALVHRVLV